jgi:putative transposase
MDWFSRYALSWELSNTLESSFCLAALEAAFGYGEPEIWNSDQGSQFTSADFLAPLKERKISIIMDGRGRALDNVFIERLWRSLKYELIYLGDFVSGDQLLPALEHYFHFYNNIRPHQALAYRTPAELFPLRTKRKGHHYDGGAAPKPPRDLTQFSSRVRVFSDILLESPPVG